MKPHPYVRVLKESFASRKISRRDFLWTATALGLSSIEAVEFANTILGVPISRPAHAAEQDLAGGILKVGMPIDPIDDPHSPPSRSARIISSQSLETLTALYADMITRPRLLESWEASDDLRTWTFTLKRNVPWQNSNQVLDADAVIWNLQRIAAPQSYHPGKWLFAPYLLTPTEGIYNLWDAQAIERVDSHTFRLNLKVPTITVPEDLSNDLLPIINPEAKTREEMLAGTGPYELIALEPGWRALFRRNNGYWGEKPNLDGVEFLHSHGRGSTEVRALRTGTLSLIPATDPEQLAYSTEHKAKEVSLLATPSSETAVARVRVDTSPFDDQRVRFALKVATDPEHVVQEGFRGFATRGEHNHLSPIHPDYQKPQEIAFNPEMAKSLLQEAGYANGLDLTITRPSEPKWLEPYLSVMISQWKKAGIRVEPRVVKAEEYWSNWKQYSFALTPWGHQPYGAMILDRVYTTNAAWNESGFSNARFDELTLRAAGTFDIEKRQSLLSELGKILQNEGPITQPVFRSQVYLASSVVEGFQPHPNGAVDTHQVVFKPPPVPKAKPAKGEFSVRQSIVDFLEGPGSEISGYELYSYLLLHAETNQERNQEILRYVLGSFSQADRTRYSSSNLNIVYLPIRNGKLDAAITSLELPADERGSAFANLFDFGLARDILFNLCHNAYTEALNCDAASLIGPFLIASPWPVSTPALSASVRPPLLFVDLSGMHHSGFGEVVHAFGVQVTRKTPFDREAVDALKLRVLEITLRAGSWFEWVGKGLTFLKIDI